MTHHMKEKKKNIHKRYLTVNDRIDSDLIILRQTLEHIPNYFNFLKMLKKSQFQIHIF